MNSHIEPLFPTPIYMARLIGDNRFDKIQSDFQSVFDDLVAKNKFSNKKFGGNTHLLSNVDFTENLIGDYNLQNFQIFLNLKVFLILSFCIQFHNLDCITF